MGMLCDRLPRGAPAALHAIPLVVPTGDAALAVEEEDVGQLGCLGSPDMARIDESTGTLMLSSTCHRCHGADADLAAEATPPEEVP